MRRLLVLAGVLGLVLSTGVAAQAQVNDDPTVDGTTGLFVIPRANTVEQGAWTLGASYGFYAREEGDSKISAFGVGGAYGLTDRVEVFASFQPYVRIDRRFTSEADLWRMHRITFPAPTIPRFIDVPLSGVEINEHPFAIGPKHDGVGDLAVGAKYKFLGDPYDYDGMAIQGWVKFPTADYNSGIGTGRLDVGTKLIGSLEAWETVGWNAYVGYVYRDSPNLEKQLNAPLVRYVLGEPQVVLPTPFPFFVSPEFLYGIGFHFPTRASLQFVGEWMGTATTRDMTSAYTGGDDLSILQWGLRASFDGGLSLNAAANYNANISVRDWDWQSDPNAVKNSLRRWGLNFGLAYSTSRRVALSFAGTAPRAVPLINQVPTLTCQAERSTIRQGESVRLMATAVDPDGDPLTVTWNASAGSLSATTGTEVTWNSSDVPAGQGPIAARVTDGYGGTADCELRVTVEMPPPPALPTVLDFTLDGFNSGSARVDNRHKAILDDVALQMRQNPGAMAVITGHTDSTGPASINQPLAMQRADNAKAYLVETHGIDPSRISTGASVDGAPVGDNTTRAGRAQNRRVVIVVTIPPR